MNVRLLEEAARLAQGAEPELARPLIERLLRADGPNPDALSLLGLIAQRCGDAAGAVTAFEQACDADPEDPGRLANLGVALKQIGRLDEAIAVLKQSLAIRPGAGGTLANLGSALIAAGQYEEALAPLHASVSLDPRRADGWNNLGVALARLNRRIEASEAYQTALRIEPGHLEAALNFADATSDSGQAEAIALRILRDHPGHARAANILAAFREKAGDLEGAIAIYGSALANHPSVALRINLVLALLRCGRAAEALAHADQVIAENPGVTTALAYKCVALDRLTRIDDLNELMTLDRFVTVTDLPHDPEFHAMLEAELRGHPSLTFEPEGLVTRKGRQSDELAEAGTPALRQLAIIARAHLSRRAAELSSGDHPWLQAKPTKWDLTMWGTILQPGGAVEPHIHAPNWLSGVYYPAVPEDIAKGEEGGLAIGLFPTILGGGGTATVLGARPGRLVLFPSWLWHATLPFTGARDRISFAFDLVPSGIGQKHHLRK